MGSVTRRGFLQAAGGLAAATSGAWWLSGCAPAVNTGAKKTISFWAFSDTRTAWQKKAWELYKQQKNPDFEIEWLIFPFWQMHDMVLITSQAGSGGPDIADIEIGQFARFIKGDPIFVDLKPKLQEVGALDKMYGPSATDPWTWQGQIYGVGNELNACLMSYQWELWEKAGVKTPIETWEEFAEEGKRYHADTGKYLIDNQYTDWGHWWMLTLQQKGGFFGPDGLPTLNGPAGINTLNYMKTSYEEGWTNLRPVGPSYQAALGAGDIATLLGPSWQFSGFTQQNLPDTKGKWHLQPLPRWEAGGSRTATWGGTGVSVLTTSKNVEEAVDFVVFEHTTTEALMFDFAERQVWPTWRPAFEDPRLSEPLEFFDNQRVGELIEAVSPEINQWFNSPFWTETTDACVRVGITPAMQNKGMSAEQTLTSAQAQAQKVIDFQSA